MDTPIADFIRDYRARNMARLHMPGHKGRPFLGCESWDITEIHGADALYEAEGIIASSEKNAAALFGTERTLFSTEGSSQCIRAMVHLAACRPCAGKKPWFLAGRNAHKAFLYALALNDAEVTWLWPRETDSLCACPITPEQIAEALDAAPYPPAAVYLTSPDYLGSLLPLQEIAEVCHRHGTLLLVDNAHGAYLHFLSVPLHPMDLGADLCCDSAHKTLPVLTGGAYLHISPRAAGALGPRAKGAMALFGSTSPSYLILASLDLCNRYLAEGFREKLARAAGMAAQACRRLRENGWQAELREPLKLTLRCPALLPGPALAQRLRDGGVECEYADREYLVLMISTETAPEGLDTLTAALGKNTFGPAEAETLPRLETRQAMSVREAVFAPQTLISAEKAVGRICAAPAVGCPPAIPIAVSGEIITENAAAAFARYGIREVAVVEEHT